MRADPNLEEVPETLSETVRWLARRLAVAGIEDGALDARRLVAAAAGIAETRLITEPTLLLRPAVRRVVAGFASRRLAHEPVSRIVGRRAFFGREFVVTPDVLDPRPETETLVEFALALLEETGLNRRPLRILDVGTGSGAVLLTLLAELADARGTGSDVSPAALAIASENAGRLGLTLRCEWRLARSLDGIEPPFDLVVSNPPYIPSADLDGLAPEVRCYDPRLALDGGIDGLDVVREILQGVAAMVPAGVVVVEIGQGQAEAAAALGQRLLGARLAGTRTVRDLGGVTRCVAFLTQF